MKIVCWNVNGLRAVHKKGSFFQIFDLLPDVICLQETKATIEQVPEEVKNISGFDAYFNSPIYKKGYSGVAIYTKVKPVSIAYSLNGDERDVEGRIITLEFEEFYLLNIYFPNGGGGPDRLEYKLKFYDEFLAYIEKLRKKRPIVFCGDINTAHREIDLARPKENEKNTGFLPVERAWIDKLISKGYVDVFRKFHSEKREAYTYWDMKTFARERNVGWRIDYFFVSSEFLPNVNKTEILSDIFGSDHCPLTLELK